MGMKGNPHSRIKKVIVPLRRRWKYWITKAYVYTQHACTHPPTKTYHNYVTGLQKVR